MAKRYCLLLPPCGPDWCDSCITKAELEQELQEANTKEYRIWSGEHQAYWRPDAAGYTTEPRLAGRWPLTEALKYLSGAGPEKKLELREAHHLAPCPFCGHSSLVQLREDRYRRIECGSCCVSVSSLSQTYTEGREMNTLLVDRWNSRRPPSS